MTVIVGVPASINNAIQTGTLERMWNESLAPTLLFRADALAEVWPINLGETQIFSRPALLAPRTTPRAAGTDPVPQAIGIEQWEVTAQAFSDSIDTHMPTSNVALAPLFLMHAKQLAIQAGMSLNRISRNALYTAYVGGHSATAGAQPAVNQVNIVGNGFRRVLVNGRQTDISVANPIAVIFGAADARNLTAFVPTDANDPDGPGVATYDGADLALASRTAVRALNRPFLIRAGGGTSVDALGAADTFVMQNVIDAVARLKQMNVPRFTDGTYHLHLSPTQKAQLYADPAWRVLYTALPDSVAFRDQAIGHQNNALWYENSEAPDSTNTGAQTVRVGTAQYGRDVHAETVNAGGFNIHRAVVVGQAAEYEKFIDESAYITEAGITGKVGEFFVTVGGVQMMTERIRYILRAPQDRLQEFVGQTWSWKGDFAIPSDSLSGDAARFKRAVVIETIG